VSPVTVHAPWTRPLGHLALEVVVLSACAATLLHALRARRHGDPTPLVSWATIFVYGLAMEILSYNFVKNFSHAQFTVMFYDRQLPLYVTAVYPTLLYTGIATARRFRLPWWTSAVFAGVLIVALDFPFDLLGPVVGWWSWSDTDPNIAVRWQGVPVTSYYWHLCFGGVLAALTSRARRLWLAGPLALATIAGGLLCFVPFHALSAVGVPHGTIVGGALGLAVAWVVVARPRAFSPPDPLLLVVPALFYAFHLVMALRFAPRPQLFVIVVVTGLAGAVNMLAHRRGRMPVDGHDPATAETEDSKAPVRRGHAPVRETGLSDGQR
jgi:hypothetical protein